MRTFLLPSPDFQVVMTYPGEVAKIWQSEGGDFGGPEGGCWGGWKARMKLVIKEKKGNIVPATPDPTVVIVSAETQ